jgi:hypothetical protein
MAEPTMECSSKERVVSEAAGVGDLAEWLAGLQRCSATHKLRSLHLTRAKVWVGESVLDDATHTREQFVCMSGERRRIGARE